MSRVSMEPCRGRENRRMYGRKDEEYIADFCLVSRRMLDDFEQRVFRIHYLLGANWKLCCNHLKVDRGTFFHAVYRIQQKLGRGFRELEPHSLYPLDEYFHGRIEKIPSRGPELAVIPIHSASRVLRPPVLKTA